MSNATVIGTVAVGTALLIGIGACSAANQPDTPGIPAPTPAPTVTVTATPEPTPTPVPTVTATPRQSKEDRELAGWSRKVRAKAEVAAFQSWHASGPKQQATMCYAYDVEPDLAAESFLQTAGKYGPVIWYYFEQLMVEECGL